MPTYTYRCTKCGEEIEVFQSMSDPPLKRCKNCRGKLQRTFHPVGIVLKGSGFHKTDYRSKPPGSSKPGEDKSEKKTESAKDSTSSDSKSSDPKTSETKGTSAKKSSSSDT